MISIRTILAQKIYECTLRTALRGPVVLFVLKILTAYTSNSSVLFPGPTNTTFWSK